MPAKRERLAERQPALASKSVLDHRATENEDALYCRAVEAFLGMARGALADDVPQGWTQGTRPAPTQ